MTLVKAELPLSRVTKITVLFSTHSLKAGMKSNSKGTGFVEISGSTFGA